MSSLSILTKDTLFSAGAKHRLARKAIMGDDAPPRLKGFQDAVAYAQIMQFYEDRNRAPLSVADVGGDQSRLLPMLLGRAPGVSGAIIDTWEKSIGQGTLTRPASQSGITLIDALLGDPETAAVIPDNSFDVVTSISVVEHVSEAALDAFFADSLRICKPGGIILHYIDLHISDQGSNYRGTATAAAIARTWGPLAEAPTSWAFRAGYVTNPDSMMLRWGERGQNIPHRARNQAVCLVARHDKRA